MAKEPGPREKAMRADREAAYAKGAAEREKIRKAKEAEKKKQK
jgi:hypothetical protein